MGATQFVHGRHRLALLLLPGIHRHVRELPELWASGGPAMSQLIALFFGMLFSYAVMFGLAYLLGWL